MKNKDTLHVSRRRFLAQLGGLTVAGMLGPSLLTPRSARAARRRDERGYPYRLSLGGDSRHGG